MKTHKNQLNRILSIILSVILALTFIPSQSLSDSIPEHDGYIVVLSDDDGNDFNKKEFNEIVKNEIYQADTILDIKREIPPDNIEYIEPNYVLKLCDTYIPNDELYTDSRWAQDIVRVQEAWDRGYFGGYTNSSDAPTIGIIDTGILGTGTGTKLIYHEDLNYSKISAGKNTINYSSKTNDDYGHGTFIAGIISAIHNNEVGVAGDMPELNLKAYKCVDASGYSTIAMEVASIYAAIEDSVDVLNISLGFNERLRIEQDAINEATSKGIIVCASAGNKGNSSLNYPASNENTISVGSINKKMTRSSFSQYNKMLDCTAPGEEITSINYKSINGYKTGKGTSFSCPQVAALAGMCKSIDPSVDHDRFMELLKITSRDAGTPGYDTSYGWGIVDYGNMLDALVPEDNSIWKGTVSGISAEADYTGSEITFDNLKITMPDGTELSAGSDYTVAYYNNIKSDMGMITLQGIGSYTGRINKYFKINGAPSSGGGGSGGGFDGGGGGGGSSTPEKDTEKGDATADASSEPTEPKLLAPIIKKLIAGKKFFTIKWKKVSGVDGYKLQYSTARTFKKGTRKTITISNKRTNYTVKKLKPGKKYYIRLRSYKLVDGKKQYSSWTKCKTN